MCVINSNVLALLFDLQPLNQRLKNVVLHPYLPTFVENLTTYDVLMKRLVLGKQQNSASIAA